MVHMSEINNKTPESMAIIEAYYKNPKGFLLLAGPNGTGKSFIAQAIHDSLWFDGDSDFKMFINQVDMGLKLEKVRKEWNDTTYFLEQILMTKILVLDDIGTRIPSPAFMDFLYAIADKRYTNKARCGTIITTNLNSTQMREGFGDAFVSRVASGTCLRIEGNDRRFNEF